MQKRPVIFVPFLIATAFFCGAMIMVVEVLGSRVIGPFFGVSLFVWTSLITVTLVSLAAGYAAGGILSDRRDNPDVLYGIILAAGCLVLLIPAVKGTVLKATLPLGLRAGALASSLVLFGPSLLLLGCVSPYVVKLAAREIRNIGRTVGLFYSISTVGSLLGTVVTGFFLITAFGVSRVFEVVGGILILLGAAWFVFFRKKWGWTAALLLPLIAFSPDGTREIVRNDGVRIKVLRSRDSFYGNLKVVDYDYGVFYTRELTIDGLVQGGVDVRNGKSIYAYPYFLERIPTALNPDGRTCLAIGLGAGIVPQWYEGRGVITDVVDIDPEVVNLARKYFGFSSSGETFVGDARYFLRTSSKTYDYIILDVFSGDTTPAHILSLEALESVRKRLAPRGVLAANLIGRLGEKAFMTASIVRTFKEIFSVVEFYPTFNVAGGEREGNFVLVAYDGPARRMDFSALKKGVVHPMAAKAVHMNIGVKYDFPPETRSIVLTDDYNPIDFYEAEMKEALRRHILEGTEADVLI